MPIARVSSDDQKLEQVLNAMIDALNGAERAGLIHIGGGSGALTGQVNGRPRVGKSLPEARDLTQCVITAQDGGGDPDDPANITYAIAAVNEGWTKDEVKPKFNRPSKDGVWMIYPAVAGDPCFWWRRRNSSGEIDDALSGLLIFNETIAEGPCG